ncbi:HDOD domain-containing protein [Pseudoduganella namucuonensis]|uniref:HD-like signal output (HDOD) domain, no enzymatic activity n=1 Tax=Pseudoduganella namucuonensis TaxID=1035707 RepID=A0A1I7EZK3_9BURK|nr:HDOD domain-containing protein [Pseudoduganella namucuonensis]SFU29360.1 HD-like signal output (HDOD) domain, no enzymatic activity [Pseudoduganella namucuonensis]
MLELIDFAELKAAGLLPSPTPAAQSLMLLCERPDSPSGAVAERVAADPVLLLALRRLAGAAAEDGAASVVAAAGPLVVRQMALGLDLYAGHQRGACAGFDYGRHWSHSFAMACAAQVLAAELPVASASEIFSLALLADVGRLALATARPRSYARLLRDCGERPASQLLRAESVHYGYSHLNMGAALARGWQLGRDYSEAVQCQEAPHMAVERRVRQMARILQTASCVADLFLAGQEQRAAALRALAEMGSRLPLDMRTLLDLVDEANMNWRQWCEALELDTSAAPPTAAADAADAAPAREPQAARESMARA